MVSRRGSAHLYCTRRSRAPANSAASCIATLAVLGHRLRDHLAEQAARGGGRRRGRAHGRAPSSDPKPSATSGRWPAGIAAAAKALDVTWEFNVTDDVEPNAFALPGGYVYITRGWSRSSTARTSWRACSATDGACAGAPRPRRAGAATPFALLFRGARGNPRRDSPTLGGIIEARESSPREWPWRPTVATRNVTPISAVSGWPPAPAGTLPASPPFSTRSSAKKR